MLLIKNIGMLCTPVGSRPHCGKEQGSAARCLNASVLLDGERITEVYRDGETAEPGRSCETLDAGGRLVTPGLVDCHTHLVFDGWREKELTQKLSGASYLDILRAGGGILSTVQQTRMASEEELFNRAMGFASQQLAFGVTTTEIKSGYGLDMETELKQLRVIRRLGMSQPVETVATYLGAHAVPAEFGGDGDAYVKFMTQSVLPEISRLGLARYCDVFVEDGVFSAAQAQELLQTAKALGFGMKVHSDEITPIGGTELAGSLHATSAEHLIAATAEGMSALKEGSVTAVLLPMTSLYLNKSYADARGMISRGIPVAIASDFNPGSCPSLNMQLAMNLGYIGYRMTPEEILAAVTINAACAIGLGERIGTVEPGKQGDLVIWDTDNLEMLPYRMGGNQALHVIKKGKIVL